jgi:hypothetical protein
MKMLLESYNGVQSTWEETLQRVVVYPSSEVSWDLTPPILRNLKAVLAEDDVRLYLSARWKFKRQFPPNAEIAGGSNSVILTEKAKRNLLRILEENYVGTISLEAPSEIQTSVDNSILFCVFMISP